MRPKIATLEQYGRRVARAMGLLAARLDDPPDLDALAAAAAFSPCHFHRIYRLLAGETPAETLARNRLSRAAADLLEARAMAQVAKRAGYGSVAAFTRAFRAAYGVPPGEEEGRMPEITLRREPALRLAALRHVGDYLAIGAVFDRLQAWAAARGLLRPETRFVGLYWDDPASVPAAQLRSAAAITVGPEAALDDGVEAIELPAGRYAVLRFQGPYAELERAYTALYRDWLPGSGEEPADRPAMEEYLNDPRALPPAEWLTEILLPLCGQR
jgi:AraC family transcriptional regulator